MSSIFRTYNIYIIPLEKCNPRKYRLKTYHVGAKKVAISGKPDIFGVLFFDILLEKYIFN